MPRDYYDILGVNKSASDDDVKRAFRKLAHQHHPDKPTGNADKFKEINEAYQTLGDEGKRKQYDQFGHAYANMGAGGGGGQGFGGFDFSQGSPFGQGSQFDFSNLGDMFGDIFGAAHGQHSARRETRGRHIEMDAHLSFLESAFGVEKELTLTKPATCETCKGSGAEPGTKMTTCGKCGGTGQVKTYQQTILGTIQSVATCSQCRGEGKSPEKRCGACAGDGLIRAEKTMHIKIPAGVADGEILRVTSGGEAAAHGGKSGDLYLTIRVKSDPRFDRKGFDVHSREEISFTQAALGATLTVETIDGPGELKIPAGTQPGSQFRLKAKGVPFLRKNGRGDHFVRVDVHIPERLTKGQRKMLEGWEQA